MAGCRRASRHFYLPQAQPCAMTVSLRPVRSYRSEGNSPQNLEVVRAVKDGEFLVRWQGSSADLIGDDHQPVRVCTLVAVTAYGRGNGVDRRRAVAVDDAGDVTQAIGARRPRQVGGGIVSGRVVSNRIRHTQLQSRL